MLTETNFLWHIRVFAPVKLPCNDLNSKSGTETFQQRWVKLRELSVICRWLCLIGKELWKVCSVFHSARVELVRLVEFEYLSYNKHNMFQQNGNFCNGVAGSTLKLSGFKCLDCGLLRSKQEVENFAVCSRHLVLKIRKVSSKSIRILPFFNLVLTNISLIIVPSTSEMCIFQTETSKRLKIAVCSRHLVLNIPRKSHQHSQKSEFLQT